MASRNTEHPNLLFILTDDQGAWGMGCAGNTEIKSPNLDRLAREGIRFDNFFCTSPVCSPARASILTGRIPSQHGVHDFLHWQSTGTTRYRRTEYSFSRVCRPMQRCLLTLATIPASRVNGTLATVCTALRISDLESHALWRSQLCNVPLVKNGELANYEDTYASDLFTDNAWSSSRARSMRIDHSVLMFISLRLTRRGGGNIIHRRYGMTTMIIVPSTPCPVQRNRYLLVSKRRKLMPWSAAGIWQVTSRRLRVWTTVCSRPSCSSIKLTQA